MYWKINVLTKTGKELNLSLDGHRNSILNNLELDSLTIIDMVPDFAMTFNKFLNRGRLSNSQLSIFFKDFSRMMQTGLSVGETARTIWETSSNIQLKTGLERFRASIIGGHPLRSSFEETKIFPRIACISMEAAERSGQIPEISKKLGEYFEYVNENKNKIAGSLIYPFLVFITLTIASIVISIQLVPQLGFLMTSTQVDSFSMRMLAGYASFMKNDWWLLIIGSILALAAIGYIWSSNKERLMPYLFKVPILGDLLKEIEFAHIFLNLFIYIKSGINTTEALAYVHEGSANFMTNKFMGVRGRINAGSTMGEAFEKDSFFPPFIQQSMKKAEETGRRTEYLYETYKYYDSKSKESVKTLIKLINPMLMSLAFAFAGFIASFYVLIYKDMAALGAGIYH